MKVDVVLDEFVKSCLKKKARELEQKYKDASPERLAALESQVLSMKEKHREDLKALREDYDSRVNELHDSYQERLNTYKGRMEDMRIDMQNLADIYRQYRSNRKAKK